MIDPAGWLIASALVINAMICWSIGVHAFGLTVVLARAFSYTRWRFAAERAAGMRRNQLAHVTAFLKGIWLLRDSRSRTIIISRHGIWRGIGDWECAQTGHAEWLERFVKTLRETREAAEKLNRKN